MPGGAFLGPKSWYCSPSAESDRLFGLVLAFMWGGSADGEDAGPISVTSAAECLQMVFV